MPPVVDAAFKNAGKQRGLEIWRIMNFAVSKVPKEEHGCFYTGDSYIILNTKTTKSWDIHFWLGKESSQDERGTAAIKTVELDDALGGTPVQYREVQDHESALFMSYFKNGIRYLQGGAASGFHHIRANQYEKWKPSLLHCKGKYNVRCTEVECKRTSLNLGDVFILDLGSNVYVWMPPESGRLERIKGMDQARNIRDMRGGKVQVHGLDADWNTNEEFWSEFGGAGNLNDIKSAKAGGDDENLWRPQARKIVLWRVSDESGKMQIKKVSEGSFKRRDLESKDAFILDTGVSSLFVWVGSGCTRDERVKAMEYARQFVKEQGKPEWTGVVRVLDGHEPATFTQWASAWEDGKTKRKVPTKLFHCSDESGHLQVEEIARFTWKDLNGDDVMIVDNFDVIYVWIGANANANEKKFAGQLAQKYLASDTLPRPPSAVIKTLHQNRETSEFKRLFPDWA